MKIETCSISKINQLLSDGYEVEVDSPDGFIPVNFYIDKGMWVEYILSLDDGSESIRCNESHLFETSSGWKSAKELELSQTPHQFLTRNGFVGGIVSTTGIKIPIVDINVEHENHRYYTGSVSSHNTGVGKSLAMCHMAASNLVKGKNVLYITMEMAEEKISERIDANLLDVNIQDLESMPHDTYAKKIARLRDKTVGKLIVKEFPTASAGSAHFRHLLNELRMKKNFAPDIIYIDYLNICCSSRIKSGANVNSYTYIKAIAEELRGLAVEFNVPLVTATQTTRSGFSNTDVGLEDTSESFGLPATADLMFALITSEQLESLNQIMVKQLKNRYNDPTYHKRFVVGVDRAKMRLYDVEQSAQTLSNEPDDKPAFDNSEFGTRMGPGTKKKFDELQF